MTSTTTTPNQAIHLIVEEEDSSNTTMVDRPSRLRKRQVRFQQEQDEEEEAEQEQASEKPETETETHEQQQKDSMIVDDTNNDNDDNTVTRNVLVLTDEMCRELWYQQDEIDEMKADVKQCVLQKIASQRRCRSRTSNKNNSTQPEGEACSPKKEDKDRLLGLHRFSPQRSQWKRSAIYYTLLAQKQQKHLQRYSPSPSSSQSKSKPSCSSSSLPSSSSEPYKQRQVEHFIRKVSLRCTAWAREMAVKQGFKDYCAVHDPLASLFDGHVDHKSGKKEDANKRRQSTNYNDCFFSDHAVEDDHDDGDDGDGDVSNIDDVEAEIVGYDDHNENVPNTDKNNSINCCHLRVVGNNKRKHSSTVATTSDSEGVSSTPVSVMMEESKNDGRNVRRRVSTKAEDHDHNHDAGRLPPVPEFREDHLIE